MIKVNDAVAAARRFASETLGVNDLLLEEISSSDFSSSHAATFDVTLSFPKRKNADSLGRMEMYREREFKTFEVDKSTGEVNGMKIRQL